MEATTIIIVLEVLATTSVSDEPAVGLIPAQVELIPVSRLVMEAITTITFPEVLATISVSDEPVVGLTPAQVELVPVSRSVMEWGSGSASAGLSLTVGSLR